LEYDGSLLNEQANARDLLFGYLEANVPAEKIILGVSFGGKAWYGVPNRNNGLFQPYGGGAVAPTTYIRATEVQHRMQEFWHEEAQVPWLFDPETGLMITFENSRSMWLKGAFARENRLGGVMLWQIAGDDSSHVLLRSLVAGVIGNTKGMP
jgi:chitinase